MQQDEIVLWASQVLKNPKYFLMILINQKIQLNCEKMKSCNKSIIIFCCCIWSCSQSCSMKQSIYIFFVKRYQRQQQHKKCSSSSNYLWFISIEFKCGTHNSKVKCFISYLKFDAMKKNKIMSINQSNY